MRRRRASRHTPQWAASPHALGSCSGSGGASPPRAFMRVVLLGCLLRPQQLPRHVRALALRHLLITRKRCIPARIVLVASAHRRRWAVTRAAAAALLGLDALLRRAVPRAAPERAARPATHGARCMRRRTILVRTTCLLGGQGGAVAVAGMRMRTRPVTRTARPLLLSRLLPPRLSWARTGAAALGRAAGGRELQAQQQQQQRATGEARSSLALQTPPQLQPRRRWWQAPTRGIAS